MSLAPSLASGGEASAIQSVHITHVEDAANTLRTHQKAFIARGLTEALTRVIAIVVQPGVEFDHSRLSIISRRKRSRWRNG